MANRASLACGATDTCPSEDGGVTASVAGSVDATANADAHGRGHAGRRHSAAALVGSPSFKEGFEGDVSDKENANPSPPQSWPPSCAPGGAAAGSHASTASAMVPRADVERERERHQVRTTAYSADPAPHCSSLLFLIVFPVCFDHTYARLSSMHADASPNLLLP